MVNDKLPPREPWSEIVRRMRPLIDDRPSRAIILPKGSRVATVIGKSPMPEKPMGRLIRIV